MTLLHRLEMMITMIIRENKIKNHTLTDILYMMYNFSYSIISDFERAMVFDLSNNIYAMKSRDKDVCCL